MKLKYYILSFLLLFSFGISAKAATLSIDNVEVSTTSTTADIMLSDSDSKVAKIGFSISLTDTTIGSLQLGNPSSSDNFSLDLSNTGTSHIYAKGDTLSDGIVGHLKINNTSKSKTYIGLNISNIVFTLKDGTTENGTDYSKSNIRLDYTSNTSSKLSKISNNVSASLTPEFSSNTTDYKMTVKDTINDIVISPSCAESGCNTEISCTIGCSQKDETKQGKLTLAQGKNIVKIKVTSEDHNSTTDYNLIIYRGATTEGSNYLKALSIDGFSFKETFNKDVLDYTVTTDYEHENLTVKALAEDTNADVQIKGDKNLQVGDNVITITVTSALTGEKKIYNITVTREDFKVKSSTTKALTAIKKKSNTKIWLIIILAIVGLLLIAAAAYFIFFRKPGKKKIITKDGKITEETDEKNKNLSIKDNELADDLNLTESTIKPSIDDALADLMETKELELTKEFKDEELPRTN